MKAIILAAGMGNRLGSLTEEKPKAMVQVGGRELILRVMDVLDACGIMERVVVTGYKAEVLTAFLGRHCPTVTTVHNPHYTVGSIRTIETALPHLDDEFLLMNVDHIYPRRMLEGIMADRRGLMAICDFDRTLVADDMKVRLDTQKRITAISKTLEHFDGGYIGMTYCGRDMLDTYRAALHETLATRGNTANVEAILGHCAERKTPVETFDASGIGWLEVDTGEDRQSAEHTLSTMPDFLL